MARGAAAKQAIENKIREIFGKDFVGIDPSTKKIYVQAEEDGQMVQVAIAMTCPKSPFSVNDDFTATGNFGQPDEFQPVELTSEELENTRKLIEKLNL